ncbi:MAG TPA: hypothetical protein PL029_11095 [Bacteroidia bacterium]|nr:hypothetical protein [Bacteroidia bacterium]
MAEIADTRVSYTSNKELVIEDVNAAILKYAEAKQNEGARQIATILKTAEIKFSGNVITLIINNETQKEQFLMLRQNFVDAIRSDLQHSAINVELLISENEKQVKAYKPIDIFKAMSEKNPALLELKKRFDLEIDY